MEPAQSASSPSEERDRVWHEFGIRAAGIHRVRGRMMRWIMIFLVCLGARPALAAGTTIHQFSDLALAPAGDRTATVESDDPGNLSDEPHGKVVVRGADGRVLASFDPCKSCRYANPAFSPSGEVVFLANDEKAGKTT